ncbi:MAG: YihY/virulence factor BrkB family protein, partial [Planctomycetota bacterium]
LGRVWRRWSGEQLPVAIAGLAFRALLTLFPLLVAVAAFTGLITEPEEVVSALESALGFLPEQIRETVIDNSRRLAESSPAELGTGLVISVLIALWSLGNGTLALMAVLNRVYYQREERNIFLVRLLGTGIGVALALFLVFSVILLVMAPALLNWVNIPIAWQWFAEGIRTVLLALMLLGVQAILTRYATYRRPPRWRWIQGGSIFAAILWLLASGLFSWYVTELARPDRIYGAMAGLILLLLWLQLTMACIILAALINSEIEHQTDRDSTVGEDRPQGERGAFVADDSVHEAGSAGTQRAQQDNDDSD